MITAEKESILCRVCKGSVEYCFCYCPYCGDMTENCRCNPENLKSIDKTLPTSHRYKRSLWNKSKKISIVNTKDDGWWRLEKWQIGRMKFP